MESSSQNEDIEYPREMTYRAFLSPIMNFLLFALSFLIVHFLIDLQHPQSSGNILMLISIVLFGIMYFQFRDLSKTVFQLHSDRLVWLKGEGEETILYFEQVVHIQQAFRPFKGQFFVLEDRRGSIVEIFPFLESAELIFKRLQKLRPELLEEEHYVDLIAGIASAGQTKIQMAKSFQLGNYVKRFLGPMLVWTFSMSLAVVLLQKLIFKTQHMYSHNMTFLIHALVFGVIVIISWSLHMGIHSKGLERAMRVKSENGVSGDLWDEKFEKRHYRRVVQGYALFYFFLVLIFVGLDFNKLHNVSLMSRQKEMPVFGLGTQEVTFHYDIRFNCVDCKHALKQGDFVLLKGPFDQKPGAQVARLINPELDKNRRYLASTHHSSSDALYVFDVEAGQASWVPIEHVLGKVVEAKPKDKMKHPVSEFLKSDY